MLTFDEFLAIPPCTTGKHSTVDDTPKPEPKPTVDEGPGLAPVSGKTETSLPPPAPRVPQAQTPTTPRSQTPQPPEEEDDDPSIPVPSGAKCKRKACGAEYKDGSRREGEACVHHPGGAVFHEGSKGWSCCKRRVLEFDEFMKIEGCTTKDRHLFVGSAMSKSGEENVETVR